MILRVFRAKVRKGKEEEFRKKVREQSLPRLRGQDGMANCFPGAPLSESDSEFIMVTLWRDLEALKTFLGENWDKPLVAPDEAPLIEEMSVQHYQFFDNR